MADEFNAYYTWLGIPLEEQPADHYRLLGVTRLESNLDVISNAADARMVYVRTFQAGARSALSQKILNELTAAKICLLDPQKKAAYDQQLNAKLAKAAGVQKKTLPQAMPIAQPDPRAIPVQQQPLPTAFPSSPVVVNTQPRTFTRPKQPVWIPLTIGGVVLAVVAILGVLVLPKFFSKPEVVVVPQIPPTTPSNTSPAQQSEATTTESPTQQNSEPPTTNPPVENSAATIPPTTPSPSLIGQSPTLDISKVMAAAPPRTNVDLLAPLDLAASLRKGNCRFANPDYLLGIATPNSLSQLQLPHSLPIEYDFFINATYEEGVGGLSLGVVVEGRPCAATIDGWPANGTGSGFGLIGGKAARLLHQGAVLTKNKPADIVVKVRRGAMSIHVDDKQICQWTGDVNDLSLLPLYDGTSPPTLFIASWGSIYRISKAELRPVVAGLAVNPVSKTAPVNLLESLDVPKNRLAGNAHVDNNELVMGIATSGALTQLSLPHSLPTEYDFVIQATRVEGEDALIVCGVVEGYPLSAVIDGWPTEGFASSFSSLEDTATHRGKVLTNDKRAEIVAKVRRGSMTLFCDSQQICQWIGDPTKLTLWDRYISTTPPKLFIGSWGSVYRIHKAELRPVTSNPALVASETPISSSNSHSVKAIVQPERSGQLLRLLGSQSIQILQPGELTPKDEARTFEAWVRIPTFRDDNNLFGAVTETDGANDGWRFGLAKENKSPVLQLQFLMNARRTYEWHGTTRQEVGPTWHHVALVANPDDRFQLFLNGRRKANGQWRNSLKLPIKGFWIGSPTFISTASDGNLDICAFRVSKGKKYDGESHVVPARFERGDDTLVLFDFSRETSDGQIADLSGKQHHGRLKGAQWVPFSGSLADLANDNTSPASSPRTSLTDIKKISPPDEATRAKKLEEIKAVFGDEITKAKKPEEKVAAAQKLIREGRKLGDDPATLFVMLDQGRLLAAEGGQLTFALSTINELNAQFELDVIAMKLETLKKTFAPANAVDVRRQLAENALALAKSAAEIGQFDQAVAAADLAQTNALRAKLTEVAKAAVELKTDLTRQRKLFEEIQVAEEQLKSNADDVEANLKIGKYYALIRKDWDRGLPFMAKGGGDPIAKAAQLDLVVGDQPEAQFKAAEAWEKAAESADKADKLALQRRAHRWYNSSVPLLAGLSKIKAQQRYDALSELPGIAPDLHTVTTVTNGAGTSAEVFSGLIGRVLIGGKDSGVLVKYEPGRPISQQKLDRLVHDAKGTNRQQLTIQLIGALTLHQHTDIWVRGEAGNVEGGLEMRLDRKPFGGWRNGRQANFISSVQPGDHELTWALSGDASFATFTMSSSNNNSRLIIEPYYTQEMLDKLRKQISKSGKPKEISLCE